MARPRKQAAAQEQDVPRHDARAIVAVLVLLLVAAALAAEALWTGSLFVKVDAPASNVRDGCLVCVYEGSVQGKLADEASSGGVQLQPLAAVRVAPGDEVQVPGRWKGHYTLAVVDPSGTLDTRACVLETSVGKGETHVGFMLARGAGPSEGEKAPAGDGSPANS